MSLNPAQSAAAHHVQGPLLVLAGAGSGKTRVITHCIANLVKEHGVSPTSILAVSFTNKAAEEMSERMVPLIGKHRAEKLWLSTFHSFGVRFVNEESAACLGAEGKTRFSIFDQADAIGLVRDIVKREAIGDRKLDLWAIVSRISLWKNKQIKPSEVRTKEIEYDVVAAAVYPHYESALKAMRALDFDDLVCVPVRVLRDREDIREKWSRRFRHLMVDEFQDTNRVQLELVKLLANEDHNVCVVGDDDQSIYGWRGAEVGNIIEFESLFRGTKIVKLEENYRSVAPILDVANAAIARSTTKRLGKTLRSTKHGGDRVRLSVFGDIEQEAKFVAQEIRRLRQEGHLWKDAAVLYRSNLQSKLIEEELRIQGIPFQLVGGTQFFERKEVKDALAFLRAAVTPRDELSLRRIVNVPTRGIGDTTVERLTRYALAKSVSFIKALSLAKQIPDVPDAAARGADELTRALEQARIAFDSASTRKANLNGGTLSPIALALFEATGFRRDLMESGTPEEAKTRWGNVEFVIRSLDRLEKNAATREEDADIGVFLQRLALRREDEEVEGGNEVTLSSIHSAKGLEWPIVFFIGLNEGTLPHLRTIDPKASEASPTDIEEERRLFYVGVTRARERLYLTRFLRKELRGKVTPTNPSRFLEGLPEEAVEHYERDDDAPVAAAEALELGAALLAQLRNRR